jgi:cation-transporting ATPase 13A2
MTVGLVYAQSRLRKEQIFCISPRSINISGCLNCVCFDKTGTLTEDELNFAELRPIEDSTFLPSVRQPMVLPPNHPLLGCLSTCHGLTQIDGRLVGDPLDQKMFECTGWELQEPQVNDTNKFDLLAPTLVSPPASALSDADTPVEIGILRQFPFSSSLQRQSVITKQLEHSHHVLYAKGAPETIAALCDPSTLPIDFEQILARYTARGMRVLALADRQLQLNYVRVQKVSRDEAERDLRLLGLLVMGNLLKPQSRPVLQQLRSANIRCVMVTGDNMLTALSVSRECAMIDKHAPVALLNVLPDRFEWKVERPDQTPTDADESDELYQSNQIDAEQISVTITNEALEQPLNNSDSDYLDESMERSLARREADELHVAITGSSFAALRDYYPIEVVHQVIARGSVFARMSPDQKQQLIELLQSLGYYVGMCGDGANDCGALKAAHAGVSLSETEASVASPFTAKQPHIGCIPALVREGRASLVTAFGILKYMASYSLTQFMSVLLLYTFHTNLTDMQFLYVDLFLISFFFVLFGRTHAHRRLARRPPPSSLIGLVPLLSMLFQLILIVGFQCAGVWLVQRQPWYVPHVSESDTLTCDDNYTVFAVSVFQYISLAVIFSKGVPYRRPIYTNVLFLLSLVVMSAVTVYIVAYPHPFLQSLFEVRTIHLQRLIVILIFDFFFDAFVSQMDIEHIPIEFRLMIVILAFCNLLLSLFAESFVVDYLVFHKLKNTKLYRRFDTQRPAYEQLRSETSDLQWLREASVIATNQSTILSNDIEPKSRMIGSPAGDSVLSGHSSTALLIGNSSKDTFDTLNSST